MQAHPFRLTSGKDLRAEIESFTKENHITAGVVLTCVGSLQKARIRLADKLVVEEFDQKFEIVAITGTISLNNGVHLHISLADKNGNMVGGHLKEGCIVDTTAEIVIGELEGFIFARELDPNTNFKELKITKI